jgi:hypothetical protein
MQTQTVQLALLTVSLVHPQTGQYVEPVQQIPTSSIIAALTARAIKLTPQIAPTLHALSVCQPVKHALLTATD